MTRKLFLAAALAVLALTSAIGAGTAQASWGEHPGQADYRGWRSRYHTYDAPYYSGPRCWVTIYETTYCY